MIAHQPPRTSTLSLHDALPIFGLSIALLPHRLADSLGDCPVSLAVDDQRVDAAAHVVHRGITQDPDVAGVGVDLDLADRDRKSTRLNSSHVRISYAVFCLKKKK